MSNTPELFYRGARLDTRDEVFGPLRSSEDAREDSDELRRRMADDGYLYLPGLLDVDQVMVARREVLDRLARAGCLDPDASLMDGVFNTASTLPEDRMERLTKDNSPLQRLLYEGAMMELYRLFLGGPVRHFDFTWFRANVRDTVAAAAPHYDVVYMGRGTKNLFTSWTPLGDVPMKMGGLMILEHSHRLEKVKSSYGQIDVDAYCENDEEEARAIESGEKLWADRASGGVYSEDAISTRSELGGRWLSADYKVGDVVVFGMYTMHSSMDNQTDHIRLSADSRYQLASEAADERWIGPNPAAHGPDAKKGMIC